MKTGIRNSTVWTNFRDLIFEIGKLKFITTIELFDCKSYENLEKKTEDYFIEINTFQISDRNI